MTTSSPSLQYDLLKSTVSAPPPPRGRKSGGFRVEYIALLLVLLFFKQFRRPLEAYSGVEVNFKTPIMMRGTSGEILQQQKHTHEYSLADQELFDDPDESHDSHDSLVLELTPVAMKFMEDYQHHHSQHFLEEELSDCSSRANRGPEDSILDAIHQGWCPELQKRQFLVVTLDCDENNNETAESSMQMLHDFLRSIAWAMVTGRTVLYKQSHVKDDACDAIARVDPWLAQYDYWKRIYEWDDSDIPLLAISALDNVKSAKVVRLKHPPLLSFDHVDTLSSRRKLEQLIGWGMTYGMILDETIWMDEPLFVKPADSSDEDFTTTRRYVVQASGKHSDSECSISYQSPCVIYQVGAEIVEASECKVEPTDKSGSTSLSKRNMFQTLAMGGTAIDGAVLEKKYPLSNLLTELLNYRGRLKDRNFQLNLCLKESRRLYLR